MHAYGSLIVAVGVKKQVFTDPRSTNFERKNKKAIVNAIRISVFVFSVRSTEYTE